MPDPSAISPKQLLKSETGSMLIVVILVIVLAIGAIFVYLHSNSPKMVPSIVPPTTTKTAVTPTPSVTTDDMSKIDQDLSNLDTDLKSADQGMNDKQGDLSE